MKPDDLHFYVFYVAIVHPFHAMKFIDSSLSIELK